MKKNAVIFDLDGTMWNACEPVLISWNVVLRRHGLPAVKKETIESFMGKTLGQIVSLYFTDMAQEEGLKIANECVREEANYLAAHGASLYDGLGDTLRQLAQHYELCLVSNCEAGYAEAFLSYYKFEPLFADYEYSATRRATATRRARPGFRLFSRRMGLAAWIQRMRQPPTYGKCRQRSPRFLTKFNENCGYSRLAPAYIWHMQQPN